MTTREDWLRENAPDALPLLDEARSKADKTKAALDTLGVAHKEVGTEEAAIVDDAEPEVKEAVELSEDQKGVIDKMRENATRFLGKFMDAPPDGMADELVKFVMASAMQPAAGEGEEVEEDDDKYDLGGKKEVAERQTDLLDTLIATQESIVKAYDGLAADVQVVTATVEDLKALTDLKAVVDDLSREVKAMRTQLSLRPRIASMAKETEVSEEQLTAAQKSALEDFALDPVWGQIRR